ncbi:hypothetical protein [Clostridium beijerinckii]|uniref:hypothetical protein n=1 Tax=Clostridium beijerinckii TaxID=1520 RepID=UPI002433096E|nr:hypothetical protein [Clostridium beijerinckii]MDG5854386.1 hypothetical protein [Clostridium beijerinckii]
MIAYFNHSLLESSNWNDMVDYLIEVVSLNEVCKNRGWIMSYWSDIWSLEVCGQNFNSYLGNLNDKDVAQVMSQAISNGPYYEDKSISTGFSIDPQLSKGGYLEQLLFNCYSDEHDVIASLKDEVELKENIYLLDGQAGEYTIQNRKGKDEMSSLIDDRLRFNRIEDVFSELLSRHENIFILREAVKSAKKHNFRGCYDTVFTGIEAIYNIELNNIIEGMNDEQRKTDFYNKTKIQISGETDDTLKIERYRKQREFKIPAIWEKLFEWHLKIDGTNTRVHYYIDKTNKKVYIGHCGKHLDTSNYNS